MKRLDLIIDALGSCKETSWSMTFDAESVQEALAAARSLRELEPVAWYAQDNLETNDEIEVIWSSEMPTYAEVWAPLYALEQP